MSFASRFTLSALVAVGCCLASVGAFSKGDAIKVVASHVGPVNNPSETYGYFVLPFCGSKVAVAVDQDLGETLTGDRKEETAYELKFGVDEEFKELCTKVGMGWGRWGR